MVMDLITKESLVSLKKVGRGRSWVSQNEDQIGSEQVSESKQTQLSVTNTCSLFYTNCKYTATLSAHLLKLCWS